MAITAATTAWEPRESGNVHYKELKLTAGATGLIVKGMVVGSVLGTGTLRFLDDVAAMVEVGVAAETVRSYPTNPVAGDRIKVILPGALVWLPDTTDTLSDAHLYKPVFIDDGGNAQKVEVVNGTTNLVGMIGIIMDYVVGVEVQVDTSYMKQTAASMES